MLVHLKAANARRQRENDERMHLAWHVAWLTAYAPTKSADFVKLDRLMSNKKDAAPQTWGQQLAMARMWVSRGR